MPTALSSTVATSNTLTTSSRTTATTTITTTTTTATSYKDDNNMSLEVPDEGMAMSNVTTTSTTSASAGALSDDITATTDTSTAITAPKVAVPFVPSSFAGKFGNDEEDDKSSSINNNDSLEKRASKSKDQESLDDGLPLDDAITKKAFFRPKRVLFTSTKKTSEPASKEKEAEYHLEQVMDLNDISPISPNVMHFQATTNVGTIGHVAHGKSTMVTAISGQNPIRHSSEQIRNITIKLGYANAKIYRCDNQECPRPACYTSAGSKVRQDPPCAREGCGGTMRLTRHISFVDCPGHDILMATMLNGAAVMDAAVLLVSAQEPCPQPQTSEHLAAIEIMKLKHVIILQNKIDLVKESSAQANYKEIANFIEGTVAAKAPIIPVSAQLRHNLDYVLDALTKIPIPKRDITCPPRLIVIRSFDVNSPACDIRTLQGGIAGGSILMGVLKLGDPVEIRPGIVTKRQDGTVSCAPLFSTVVSLKADSNDLKFAIPGGLIAVGTDLDPALTRADRLVGQVLGAVGSLPAIYIKLEIQFFLLRRLLGVKSEGDKQEKIKKLAKGETLLLNIGSTSTGGRVTKVVKDVATIELTSPACTEVQEKIALSRRIDNHWRLVGWATILDGEILLT